MRFNSVSSLLSKILFSLLITVGVAHAQEIVNGNFDGTFAPVSVPSGSKAKITGSVAQGWRDESSWATVTVDYSQEPVGHSGAAQKVTVGTVTNGGVQFVQEMKFMAGAKYQATAWVKAAAPGQLDFEIRQSGAPYQSYGLVSAPVTTEWTQIQVSGVSTITDNGLIIFGFKTPGTYWIDDVTFTVGN